MDEEIKLVEIWHTIGHKEMIRGSTRRINLITTGIQSYPSFILESAFTDFIFLGQWYSTSVLAYSLTFFSTKRNPFLTAFWLLHVYLHIYNI